ncbi:MAG: hypothetical protein WCG03_10695, partial [Kiritimatiellales bacterium]
MRKLQHIVSLAAIMLASTSSAVLIASDSFSTGAGATFTPGQYTNGVGLATVSNNSVVVGTTGFVTNKLWQGVTSVVKPLATPSLTNIAVAGSAASGGLNCGLGAWTVTITTNAGVVTTNNSLTIRGSLRQLANTNLTGSTFFMSGLVSLGGLATSMDSNESATMGMVGNLSASTGARFQLGLQFGVMKDNLGDAYLATFAAGKTNTLGSKLTTAQATNTQMIILQLDVAAGNDTLKAWVFEKGRTNVTAALNVSDFDIGSLSNLTYFAVQGVGGMDASSRTSITMDEFRFGTTLQDVIDGSKAGLQTLTVNGGTGGGACTNGQQVAITANAPATGKVFIQWTGDTQVVNNVTYTNAVVTMPATNVTLTATYTDITYALKVNSGTGSGTYTNGQQVAISANAPAEGRTFDKWVGNTQNVASVSSESTTVAMSTNPVTLTAMYKDTRLVLTNLIFTTSGFESPAFTNGTVAAKVADGNTWRQDQPLPINTSPWLTIVQTNVVFNGAQALAMGDISNRVLVRALRTVAVTNTVSYWDGRYKNEATNFFGAASIHLRGNGASQQFRLVGDAVNTNSGGWY